MGEFGQKNDSRRPNSGIMPIFCDFFLGMIAQPPQPSQNIVSPNRGTTVFQDVDVLIQVRNEHELGRRRLKKWLFPTDLHISFSDVKYATTK